MKKLYSLIMVLIASTLCINLSAKTVKFQCNLPNAVFLNDSRPIAWGSLPVDAPAEIEWINESGQMHLSPMEGHEIAQISKNGTPIAGTSKVKSFELRFEDYEDGDLIYVDANTVAQRVFTFIGNGDHVFLRDQNSYYSYYKDSQEDGAWHITIPTYNTSIAINANEGYAIDYVEVNGNKLMPQTPSYITIYSGTYTTSQTFTIVTHSMADARDKSATINVEGDKSSIRATRKGAVSIKTAELDDFKFSADELPLTFGHSNYSKSLYKVSVNGTEAQREGSDWKIYELEDDDVIDIKVDFPKVDVPFSVVFSNEGTEDVIKTFRLDGDEISKDVWSAEGYTVPLGAQVYFSFDSQSYDISSITIDGESLDVSGSYLYYNGTVNNETGYKIEIDAKLFEPFHVKFVSADWEHIIVTAQYSNKIELTGEETIVDIPRGWSYIQIDAAEGYLINEITNGETTISDSFNLTNLLELDDYIEIQIYVEEFKRDKQLVVFVEEGTWNSKSLILSNTNSNYKLRKQLDLETGYNFINYNDNDLPLAMSLYGSNYSIPPIVYLNGEVIENNYGSYPATADMPEGSVIKLFQSEPESHSVKLSISDDAKAHVHADYVTAQEGGEFSVHHGTHIVISPATAAAAPSRYNAPTRAAQAPFAVTVDGKSVDPDETGKVVVPVTGDTEIAVKAGDVTTGVDDVTGDSDTSVTVYNLQGIKVVDNGTEADVNNLPAGLYIVNGKKTFVR